MSDPGWTVRGYRDCDERSWLRCRVLGFLDTAYFDDVWSSKPPRDPGLEVVAELAGDVVGLADGSVDGADGTIETIVVHPDHRRSGIGHALLTRLLDEMTRRGVTEVEAWTRDDPGTLRWYDAEGFEVTRRYLHVYASTPEEMERAVTAAPGLMARNGHFHAWEQEEEWLRSAYERVHACHRYARRLAP